MLELKSTYALRGLLGAFGAATIAWRKLGTGFESTSLDGAPAALRFVPVVFEIGSTVGT